MRVPRRLFLRSGAIAVVGLGSGLIPVPGFLTRAIAGEKKRRGTLVVVFLRGAADGLNVVVPHGEKQYYRLRPTIAVPRPRRDDQNTAIDLDGSFGLHPALRPLLPLWQRKQLAVIHATGSPDATRSHFDAQDFMESGTPGVKRTDDGWLNRLLQHSPGDPGIFRGVALASELPRILSGRAPALAIQDLRQFGLPQTPVGEMLREGLLDLYDAAGDPLLTRPAVESLEAVRAVQALEPESYRPTKGATYPRGSFGRNLQQVAQLIKADLGVEVAFTDVGGWDHHVNEGGVRGPLAGRLRELSGGLSAFVTDLGDRFEDVTVVTISEFGRTAAENGNRGTDHGHANCAMVLGGAIGGGRFYGRWPGLGRDALFEGRDLDLTSDYRDLMAALLNRSVEADALAAVFPGHVPRIEAFEGLVGRPVAAGPAAAKPVRGPLRRRPGWPPRTR